MLLLFYVESEDFESPLELTVAAGTSLTLTVESPATLTLVVEEEE